MRDFLLVHGSFHGSWCWDELMPHLAAAGHTVEAPDLDGGRRGPEELLPALEAMGGPVILVGHSSGGMAISALARLRPQLVGAMVYVAGFMLREGETPHHLGGDRGGLFESALVFDREAGTMSIRPELAGELFYHDCDPAIAERATARLVPEVLKRPVATGSAAETADEGLRRFYVECADDRALDPAKQRLMYTREPRPVLHTLDSGHSPFLSRPAELAAILDEIAAT
ncbi:alpha/beta fold hydrolase [Phytomonospora sp. NPDC050363]|uniref:alpha/beta fold hydrolase n=1 Tax=Phytomonospora sp. NPDC050363 TaxID=3155642 RepID=UPI0033C7B809